MNILRYIHIVDPVKSVPEPFKFFIDAGMFTGFWLAAKDGMVIVGLLATTLYAIARLYDIALTIQMKRKQLERTARDISQEARDERQEARDVRQNARDVREKPHGDRRSH